MPFKYTSSLPLCEQGNILKENKKDLSLQHCISTKKGRKPSKLWQILQNKTKQKKKVCISNTSVYFGHLLALYKLKEVWMFLITISRFLVVGGFFWKTRWIPIFVFFSFLSIIKPQSGKRQEGWRASSLLRCKSSADGSMCHNGAVFIPTGCTLWVTQ